MVKDEEADLSSGGAIIYYVACVVIAKTVFAPAFVMASAVIGRP